MVCYYTNTLLLDVALHHAQPPNMVHAAAPQSIALAMIALTTDLGGGQIHCPRARPGTDCLGFYTLVIICADYLLHNMRPLSVFNFPATIRIHRRLLTFNSTCGKVYPTMSPQTDALLDEIAAIPDVAGEARQSMTARPYQSDASAGALKNGIRYSHLAMIDMLIAEPWIKQNELAMRFGRSPSWISTIMASDAFQATLAKRRAEVTDPIMIATVEERFKGIALRAAEILEDKLSAPSHTIPDTLALRSLELASRAAGYGARQEATPVPPAEIHVHLESLGGNLTSLLRRKKVEALEHVDAEITTEMPP